MGDKIKVLVVDDSAIVRSALTDILDSDPNITVLDTAADPYEAVKKISKQVPDVITLDLEMPRMNGLVFLKKLMDQHPLPVVVISSITGDRSDLAIRALELGAINIITKPRLNFARNLDEYRIKICDAVKAAAMSGDSLKKINRKKKAESDSIVSQPQKDLFNASSNGSKLILIGASTGGTEVISTILKSVRNNLPPILIVQHMPGEFTSAFANRLNQESSLIVKEAEDGDVLKNGCVYIANGFYHLLVKSAGSQYKCKIEPGELVNRHRPSVDVLFNSVAEIAGKNVMGIILTGMGKDGANGMLQLKNKGAVCIAQDETSSIVFGMPKEAINLDAVDFIGNPSEIIDWINKFA
ncbi:protein-glutamate methylesterase/protein-glutamine glutaminase [Sunxiuqinia sp. A32]|uniref:protein-glutamate methylesterase/protein-glutamine glutaminase n=1 Tax=Sunxiuqinia sp. A32 TaxID=3461496 RepID=UPI00404652E8